MTDQNQSEIAVLHTSSEDYLSACSLVLSAVNIAHTISREDSEYIISVAESDSRSALYHLASYRQENENWPPQDFFEEQKPSSIQPPTLLVMAALAIFYNVTGPWSEQSVWFNGGAGDSTAILRQGEYFRLITALTLHADITHLLGNFFLGGFLLHFFCKSTGPGIGVCAVLVSAALGNAINVYLHGPGHLFVGFSTAVFAAIGMLAMISYHTKRGLAKIRLLVPFMAGAAMLAMTGSSGERTDLGAHLFGLLSGFAVGRLLITDFFIKLRDFSFIQFVMFFITMGVVFFCWQAALNTVY